MQSLSKNIQTIEENIEYYNAIADNYDELLEQSSLNKHIREKVKEKFIGAVKHGYVLDFGGGTGSDLEWLSAHNYKIMFCEPSSGMREKAIQYNNAVLHNDNIIFLDPDKTNFIHWDKELPFTFQVDAILSNFNVINNIPDINKLFSNLALVLKPGGNFILLALIFPPGKMLLRSPIRFIHSLLFGSPVTTCVWNNNHKQTVFMHSIKKIKKAAAKYFTFCSIDVLQEANFMLIHLVKK